MRVAFVGLDAAEWTYLDKLMSAGDLPYLAQIRSQSACFGLRSASNWRNGRVWETFLSGADDWPSAVEFDPLTYDVGQLGARPVVPFYARVPGLNVLALDVPYLSLWHEVEGVQVTAWGGHDAGYPRASRPLGTLTEIDSLFGPHPAFLNDFNTGWHHASSIETLTSALVEGAAKRAEVLDWLQVRNPNWDLLLTVMSEAHSAGEYFWHGEARDHPLHGAPTARLAERSLNDVHRSIDSAVGRIVEGLPPDAALVVASVHGMGTNYYDLPSMVLLPELLYRAHFGRPGIKDPNQRDWKRRGFPPLTPPQYQEWGEHMRGRRHNLGGGMKDSLRSAAPWASPAYNAVRSWMSGRPRRKLGELSRPIPPETRLLPHEIEESRESLAWAVPSWYQRYWPEMRAFVLPSFYDARIRVNLRGREANGTVDLRDYLAVCDWVEKLARACRDPRNGNALVADVLRPREADPLEPDGPDADLVFTWDEPADAVVHPDLGMVGPFPYRRTGGHTDHGFAFIRGAGIEPGVYPEQSALDLTPTILGLLGHEISGLPGRQMVETGNLTGEKRPGVYGGR